MITLCLSVGPWQQIVLESALRVNRPSVDDLNLLIYEPIGLTERLRDAVLHVAHSAGTWSRTLCDENKCLRYTTAGHREAFDEAVKAVRQLWNRDELPKQIWLCNLFGLPERQIAAAFPDADIVAYEEGLDFLSHRETRGDWQAFRRRGRVGWLRQAAAFARWNVAHRRDPWERYRAASNAVPADIRRRIVNVYTVADESVPLPPALRGCRRTVIDPAVVREVVADADEGGDMVERPPGDQRRALLLGQYLNRYGTITWDEERGLYEEAVERLKAGGYDILWKEHPRAETAFGPTLQGIETADLDASLPIELAIGRLPIDLCVAGASTALLHLPRIFGIETRTLIDHVYDRLPVTQQRQADVIRGRVKSLELQSEGLAV